MPRRIKPHFHHPQIADLLRQLSFAPSKQKLQQIQHAEQLHDQLDSTSSYPLDFVIFRITSYRNDYALHESLPGSTLQADLRLFIDQLSYTTPLPSTDQTPSSFSPHQLAKHWHVTTKTLSRWRAIGLRWRWELHAGRKRLVYPPHAVSYFAQLHPQLLTQANTNPAHLTPHQRKQIILRAKRLVQAKTLSMNQVAAHLATRTHRAVETIRQILIKYDQSNPNTPIFPHRTTPLTPSQRHQIFTSHQQGSTISQLCAQFQKTPSTIKRAIQETRASQLKKIPLHFHSLPTFSHPDAQTIYLQPLPLLTEADLEASADPILSPNTDDLPLPLRPQYQGPTLPSARLHAIIIRYNYTKFLASNLRSNLHPSAPAAKQINQIQNLLELSRNFHRQLMHACRPFLLLAARQHLLTPTITTSDSINSYNALSSDTISSSAAILELLEAGHEILLTSLEHFDIAGPAPLENFLNHNLRKHFATITHAHSPPSAIASAPIAHRKTDPAALLQRLIQRTLGS